MLHLRILASEEWMARGLCRQLDPELWYAERGQAAKVAQAKAVCRTCEVQAECLTYALENDENFGVWGGASPDDRKDLRRGGLRGLAS